jgi:molecular chaperone GrpE
MSTTNDDNKGPDTPAAAVPDASDPVLPAGDEPTPVSAPDSGAAETAEAEPESSAAGAGEGEADKPARKHRRHDHEQARSFKEKLERRDHEIEFLRRELNDLKDKYLRAAADMENTRKRLEREKADFLQFAQTDLIKELLVVLDNFERARKTGEGSEAQGFQEGIDLIHKQFTDLLRKRGVTPIERPDRKFDPAVHQAILTEEKDGLTEAEVGEELQKGYFLHDRLLRPALVKVYLPKRD